MVLIDLRQPTMRKAAALHDTKGRHPIEELKRLADPAYAVIMIYNHDLEHHVFTCLCFEPTTGQWTVFDGDTAEAAFEDAQQAFLEAEASLEAGTPAVLH